MDNAPIDVRGRREIVIRTNLVRADDVYVTVGPGGTYRIISNHYESPIGESIGYEKIDSATIVRVHGFGGDGNASRACLHIELCNTLVLRDGGFRKT